MVKIKKALETGELDKEDIPKIYGLQNKVIGLANEPLKAELIRCCKNENDLLDAIDFLISYNPKTFSPYNKDEIVLKIKKALETGAWNEQKIPSIYGLQSKVIELINTKLKVTQRKPRVSSR